MSHPSLNPPDDNELKKLAKIVRLTPHDKDLAEKFFDGFEDLDKHAAGKDTKEFHALKTEYLMLKYFHEHSKWHYLNLLGSHYLENDKHHLTSLCLLESLRINPMQPEILSLYEKNKHLSLMEYLEKGPDPECTISVIMGTYKRTSEIKESIQSVLDQTFRDFELIVVNDGGPDEVESIVRSFNSSRIHYYKLEENRGHAAALNEGVKKSRGKYIAYLDDDDVYYPDHLENLLNSLISSGNKFVYSNTIFIQGNMDNGKFRPDRIKGVWSEKYDKNKLILECYIANLSMLHERSLFADIGLFSEDLNAVMDWELLLRAALKYDFYHLDKITGEYRFGGRNITSTNRLLVDFYTTLIQNYYMYYRGLTTFIRYHLNFKGGDTALHLYRELKCAYEEYFKATPSFMELLSIAVYYKDDVFVKQVLNDFFNMDPRNCVRYIYGEKSIKMFCMILPLFPRKALGALVHRVSRKMKMRKNIEFENKVAA